LNNIFISGFSFGIDSNSSLDDWDNRLDELENFLKTIESYNNPHVNCDCLQFKLGNETLDDIVFEISGYSEQLSTEMIKDFNQVISSNKSKVLTETAINFGGNGPVYHGKFISFYVQRKISPYVDEFIQISNTNDVFNFNYLNLGLYPISLESFCERAKKIFNGLFYHSDFDLTLLSVIDGDFKIYSIEFARALLALHLSIPKLTNQGFNVPDLTIIKNETALAGRTMACTAQGRNKRSMIANRFKITDSEGTDHEILNLNCEYHLKINFDNKGNKISRNRYNRAYFGLPLINGKKYIALLHLGCHLNDT